MMDFIKSLETKKKPVVESRSYEDMLLAQLEKKADKLAESDNPQDHVSFDIPLLIRVFELIREGAETDVDVHNITERILAIKERGVLTMDDYKEIAGDIKKGMVPDKPEKEPSLNGETLNLESSKLLAGVK